MVIWLSVGGASTITLTVFLFAHMRQLHRGRLCVTQSVPGTLTFEPWKRSVSLDAEVSFRNADRDLALQLSSVEIFEYRVDGTRHRARVKGRLVGPSGPRVTIRAGDTAGLRVTFEINAPTMPRIVDADVCFRDAFDDEVRTRLRFESHRFTDRVPLRR